MSTTSNVTLHLVLRIWFRRDAAWVDYPMAIARAAGKILLQVEKKNKRIPKGKEL